MSTANWIRRRTLLGEREPMGARRLHLWNTFFSGIATTTALGVYAL